MKTSKLEEKTNAAISELVCEKAKLQSAYNYYNGIMDKRQHKYLEDNYGIGNPTSIEFIPMIKKHVDALLGEYLGTPILPKISCKDSDTINNIFREKLLKIIESVHVFLKQHLQNSILKFIDGKDITDKNIELQINEIVQEQEENFISLYEVASLNVLEYIMQSRTTDIHTKLRHLFLDLLITGYDFYRVRPSINDNNIDIEVLNPLDTFVDLNPESPYIKDSYRCVVRKWYTKNLILNKYGRKLSKEDVKLLTDNWDNDYFGYYDGRASNYSSLAYLDGDDGIVGEAGVRVEIGDDQFNRLNLIPVYEVEWTETDKNFVMHRYSTIRVGEGIYIFNPKDENVIRSKDNPNYCSLSINGVYFNNRSNEPYSLVLACASLLDKVNLLHFYRDNLIANSGTTGDWVDESLIPLNLGVSWPERLQKWLAYKKAGIALLDTSLEGRLASGQASLNTIFNGYDDTVRVLAIQAIQMTIDSLEATCSSITGVFRERLNGIQLRDAVTNVLVSVNNSFTVTKPIYSLMDLVTNEILLDSLNLAKRVFQNGLTGVLILGDKQQKIFTALPEHFTLTDFDIKVQSSSEVIKELQELKNMIPTFILNGTLDPEIIFEAMTSKSLTDIKLKVKASMKKRKEENNQIQQLQQQGELLNQQLQQAQKELQKAHQQLEQLNQLKLQLEQQKIKMQNEVDWFKAKTERAYKEGDIKIQNDRTELEKMLMYDGNPYNDQVKNVR